MPVMRLGLGVALSPGPVVSISGAASQTRVGSRTVITIFGPASITANQAFTADVLVVGGGGGGCCGGGGGGGYQAFTAMLIASGTTLATVGAGGAGAAARGGPASNGGNSTFGAITAYGGGAGGQVNGTGADGGCGGGAGGATSGTLSGGTGSQGGNGGGTAGITAADYPGGGGGGAGANGATPYSATGGDGLSNSITGTATYYAGGGGGGSYAGTPSNAGGLGGGGASHGISYGDNGANGLGGGGGASSQDGASAIGGNGGSGIVIISYASGSTAYLGPVATRTVMPVDFDNTTFQATSRTRHRAKVAITAIQVAVAGFRVNSYSEAGLGADSTYYVSVQQSSGSTVTRLPFGGSASGVVKDGTFALTDLTPISIAAGEYFWIKIFYQNAAGVWICVAPQDGVNGEGFTRYASGATDTTMTFGAAGLGVANVAFGPLAVLGMTSQPTVALLGDSRQQSGGDDFDGTSTDIGECARSIGALLAYINMGVGGDSLKSFVTGSNSLRKRLINFCSGVQCEYGINDFNVNGDSAATLEANIVALRAILGSKQLGYDTISPQTGGTNEAARVQFNADLRAGTVTGVSWFSEVADVVETARNSNIWKPGYSSDSLHGSQTAMLAVLSSGAINPALFTY